MAKDERLISLPTTATTEVAEIRHSQPPDVGNMYSPMYDEDPFGTKRSFREYLSVVLKRKWLILSLVIATTVFTALYMYRLPSEYQAQAQIQVKPPVPKASDKGVSINLGMDPYYKDTQVKLLQNPQLMREVVINLGLYKDANLFKDTGGPGLLNSIKNTVFGSRAAATAPSLPVVSTESSEEEAITETVVLSKDEEKTVDLYAATLMGGLMVEPVERTNLIFIRYKSSNQDLTVKIPNGVAEAFIKRDIRQSTQGSKQSQEEVQKQIEQLSDEIEQLDREKLAYLKANDLPLGTEGAQLEGGMLNTLSTQLLTAQEELRRSQFDYQAAIRAKASGGVYSIPKVGNNASIQAVRNQIRERELAVTERGREAKERLDKLDEELDKLNGELKVLNTKYTDEMPSVIAVKAQINQRQVDRERIDKEIQNQVEKELKEEIPRGKEYEKKTTDEVIGSLRAEYEAAQNRVAKANSDYLNKRSQANLQGQAVLGLTNLNQELDTKRKSFDSLLQRQTTQQMEVFQSTPDNITVQTPAKGAALVGPQRSRSIAIAFLVALAAGIGLAFLLDYLDDSIKSSDDIARHLGLPTLALIPHVSLDKTASRGKLPSGLGGTPSTALIALENNSSVFAEAYRHLRTSLLFSSAGKPPQTILVTSSQPSEGKTTTVINTAITLAQAGAETVIIDCDLRRPRLHHHFQIDNTHGITNFLSGEKNINKLVKPIEALPNLNVITSGPIPPNPAELLSSNEMRELIAFLRSNYKHVIIDSPPALSFTDAAILSTLVDGVVIVAMTGKSSINLTRRFKKRLQDIGARIYGVVLTGLKRHAVDYGYGYGYGYSYYYNYGENGADKQKPEVEQVEK